MALKRGSPRDEVYHRLILNAVGGDYGKLPQPTSVTEYLHQIRKIVDDVSPVAVGRGAMAAKAGVLQVTRLAYHCMRNTGIVYRQQVVKTPAQAMELTKAATGGTPPFKDSDIQEAIDGEREYQNNLGEDRTDGADRSVADYLMMLKVYCRKAEDAWVNCPGDYDALDQIRKLAGIGVRCLEEYGIHGV
jgi:hypothetical protein